MTVGELIDELSKYPRHKTVRLVAVGCVEEADSMVEADVDCVVYEGSHVAIEST